MEDYGFIPLSDEEASHLNMPYSSGLFSTLYSQLEKDKNTKYYGKALEMSPNEKKISFLNRYMIFKKVRNVDGSHIMKLAMKNYEFDEPVVKPIEEDKDTKTKKSGKKRVI